MKKPKKGYQFGGPVQEDPAKKKAVNDQFYGVSSFKWKPSDISSAGYKRVAPGIYSNPAYDPNAIASAPQYVSYKQLPPGHPMLSKDQKEAYGFYGVEDPFKPKTSAVPIKTPQVQAPVVQTPISTSPVAPPQKERMVPNSFGQMGAGTYAQYDAQGNPVWYNKQGPMQVTGRKDGGPVKGYASGGWIDQNGNPVNDPNLANYSDEEMMSLGYKKAPSAATGQLMGAGKNFMQQGGYSMAGNALGSIAQSQLNKGHGGQSVAGGIAGGALQGAGMGMQYGGPWGAAIGAGIGGLMGGLNAKKAVGENRQMAEQDATGQAIANQNNPNQPYQSFTSSTYNPKDYKKTFGIQGFLANGGPVKGGKIEGPGGPKDDAIPAKVDGFVVPAENSKVAEFLRAKYLTSPDQKANLKQGGGVKVKVSNGEHLFTPKEVSILSKKGIDLNKLAPNSEVSMNKGEFVEEHKELVDVLRRGSKKERLEEAREQGQELKDVRGYKDGGGVGEDPYAKYSAGARKNAAFDAMVDKYRKQGKSPQAAYYMAQAEYNKPGKQSQPLGNDFLGGSPQAPAAKLGQKKPVGAPKSMGDLLSFDANRVLNQPDQAAENMIMSSATPTQPAVVNKWKPGYTTDLPGQPEGAQSPSSGASIGKSGMDFGGIMGGLQAALGAGYLLNQGKRPTYSIGPNFQGQVQQSIAQSRYGYTPEQKSLLQNQAVENRNTALKNVYSMAGGNAGVALNNARAVFNDAYTNRLKTASDDESLRLQKMNMANSMAAQEEGLRRQAFQDRLAAFMQNQSAGAQLLGTGLDNIIGSQRYAQVRQANDEVNKLMYGA